MIIVLPRPASAIGPRINPSTMAPNEKPYLSKKYPDIPKINISHTIKHIIVYRIWTHNA